MTVRPIPAFGVPDCVAYAVGNRVQLAVAPTSALANVEPIASDAHGARGLPAPRATESRAARVLLRLLLARVLGADCAGPIAARPSGQPYLPQRADLAISLSHTPGYVAVAVAVGVAVGIDVQIPVPVSPAVIRRCCTPRAQRELDALSGPARDLALAWIWSVQEACVKSTGAGLAGRPWAIPVDLAQREGQWRGHRWLSLPTGSAVPVSIAFAMDRHLPRPPRTSTRIEKEPQ